MSPHITYKELLKLVSYGIFSMKMKGTQVSDERLKECVQIENAMYKGIYIGSPGRDIYYMLPYLSKDQMIEVASLLAMKFPNNPPKRNHVNISACMRFIYGQFDKQGILRSEKDFERMKQEDLEWDLSITFLDILIKEFKNNKNYYGLTMTYEQMAHRLGDKAVLNDDKKRMIHMEKTYGKSLKYAYKCNSYKHLFSLYYYMGKYFLKFGDKENSLKYFRLTIDNVDKYYNKYYPKGDRYWSPRLKTIISYIEKKSDKKSWKELKRKYNYNIKKYLSNGKKIK
jgi:hypothetical protein